MTGQSDIRGQPGPGGPGGETGKPGPKQSHMGLIVKNAGIDGVGTAFNILIMFASSVIITRTIGAWTMAFVAGF